MRIVVTSDIHISLHPQLTSRSEAAALVARIADEQPDAVVIAGDLGHTIFNFQSCLDLFKKLAVPVGVLPGNHDVWQDRESGVSSDDLLNMVLPDMVRQAGFIWLESENIQLGPAAIAGSMVWCDYSAVDPNITLPESVLAANKRDFVNDARMIDWDAPDQVVAERLVAGLLTRLQVLEHAADVERVLVVTHYPVFDGQLVRRPESPLWGITNAYFGNLTAGQAIVRFSKVRYVISGHTHIGKNGVLTRENRGDIAYAVVPSEYQRPRYIVCEL